MGRFRNPLRRNKSGIPRVTLQARRRVKTLNPDGYATTTTNTSFDLLQCTVQPASGDDLLVVPEGLRDKEAFNIFTQTNANPAVEGTNSPGDQVFLTTRYASDEGWFTVVKRKAWQNGVINHYHLIVIKENEI